MIRAGERPAAVRPDRRLHARGAERVRQPSCLGAGLMNPATEPRSSEWVNGAAARQLLGKSASALQRAAMLGHVRVALDPGVPPRYHAGDVQRYAQATSAHKGA